MSQLPPRPPQRPAASFPTAIEHKVSGVENFTLAHLLAIMLQNEASDLHFTIDEPLKNRVHGSLVPMNYKGHHLQATKAEGERILTEVLTDNQKEALKKNLELDFAYGPPGLESRFRCNYFYAQGQLRAVFRQIPNEIKSLEQLKMPQTLTDLCHFPRGLVLVTGPTGSGKSTTLAAMIDLINRSRNDHILSIEDPVEFVHQSKKSTVSQREVGEDTKSFANALRAALREDPDVILVGEMRDPETISLGITAAETGHLVFATLHTQSASQTVDRIIDSFAPEQQNQIRSQLSLTLKAVITQQLLPTADGSGRTVALEILTSTAAVGNLLREGKTHQIYSTIQTGRQFGMQTMEQSLAQLVVDGVVAEEVARERASEPEELARAITAALQKKRSG